jgi:hypothetical protein
MRTAQLTAVGLVIFTVFSGLFADEKVTKLTRIQQNACGRNPKKSGSARRMTAHVRRARRGLGSLKPFLRRQ